MVGKNEYLGVSAPLSLAGPSSKDELLQKQLETALEESNMYESAAISNLRQTVMSKLEEITKRFIYEASIRKGFSPDDAKNAGGKALTFGSCRLGVQAANADIDAVCICPTHITRSDFFEGVYKMLARRPEVTGLTAIRDAFVPIIKLKFSGIPVDLLCARLNLTSIPDDLDIDDTSLLVALDERCIRSVNGTRVADEILKHVPDVPTFRTAVRCIKLWAVRRGIYSNVFGFLGGVAWALMVARVCQLYPNACASTVASKVFSIMVNWQWPHPVVLRESPEGPPLHNIQSWNPKRNPIDKTHKMPIITPAYPTMCATHNMTNSTFRIVIGECKRAAQIMDKIMVGSLPWDALFESHSFFQNYRHYLQIVVSSDDSSRQLRWGGLVEARLRGLTNKLEAIHGLVLVHPFVEGFDNVYTCTNAEEIAAAVNGVGNSSEDGNGVKIYTRAYYIGLYFRLGPGQIDISRPISEFKRYVRSWKEYDEQHMGVVVRYLRRSVLFHQ
ncbi:Poly(A) polymerase central domain-containing protein [Fennellomyces sp. T-0311]|nr:Poly(A) polymerase central domain-containing protein [Fennellomyces sp. T-0311]